MYLRIVLEPSDERGYTVFARALRRCVPEGDTLQEARGNTREAIFQYREPAKHPTVPEDALVEEISV